MRDRRAFKRTASAFVTAGAVPLLLGLWWALPLARRRAWTRAGRRPSDGKTPRLSAMTRRQLLYSIAFAAMFLAGTGAGPLTAGFPSR